MTASYVKDVKETDILSGTSKYLKAPRERAVFKSVAIAYFFAYYIMPPYFGIPTPGFDLTALRIMLLIALIMIFSDKPRQKSFIEMIRTQKISLFILPYIIVTAYTMVLRADFNAFLNPFLEIAGMFLLMYMIKEALGIDETVRLIIIFLWILVVLGVEETITKRSPFSYLRTLDGLMTGRFIRDGNYRIMSNCGHALSYGLLLITAIPFAGYDIKKKEFDVFRRPVLLSLLIFNVFMNGSRSTLGLAMAELVLMFVLSDRKFFRKNMMVLLIFVVSLTAFLIVGGGTPIGRYIMLQITSVVDTLLGTSFSIKYGANLSLLTASSSYRDQLKGIFGVSWLNPLLGIGRKRNFIAVVNGVTMASIDNHYIAEYIRYAYPGMISYIFFLGANLYLMIKDILKSRSSLMRVLFISTALYCTMLYVVDSLMTLKYLYINFALFACMETKEYIPESDNCRYIGKRKSRYVKK